MPVRNMVLFVVIALLYTGCFFRSPCREKSYKDQIINDLQYILSSEQRRELQDSVLTDTEVAVFVEHFWSTMDSVANVERDGIRQEYEKRLAHVKQYYRSDCGWNNFDRARVYMVYGPPGSIERIPMTWEYFSTGVILKSYEVWVYDEPAEIPDIPQRFKQFYPNMQIFVFADKSGAGVYQQVFSTVKREHRDPYSLIE